MKNDFLIAKNNKEIDTLAEINANIFNLKCLGVLIFACILTEALNEIKVFTVEKALMRPMIFGIIIFLLAPILAYLIHDLMLKKTPSLLEWKGLKMLIVSVTYMAFVVICIFLSFHATLVMSVPILMTSQYRYNKKLIFAISLASIMLVPISIYGSYFFGVPDRNLIKGALSEADSLIIANRFKIYSSKRMVEILFHYVMPQILEMVTVIILATGISKRNARMLDTQANLAKTAHDEMEKRNTMQSKVIEDLASVIETRDIGTGEHVKRTKKYVELLAKELKKRDKYKDVLTDGVIADIVSAAPLHDVGKIAVPDSLLLKPGKLTDDEFEEIKKHAQKGGEMIESIFANFADEGLITRAYNIANSHHEKWNGSGYPRGLSGDDIPIEGRLMAIADVFDALVSDRVYKKAMPPEEAFAIIVSDAGTHFDPEIVDALMNVKDEFIKAAK